MTPIRAGPPPSSLGTPSVGQCGWQEVHSQTGIYYLEGSNFKACPTIHIQGSLLIPWELTSNTWKATRESIANALVSCHNL